MLAGDTVRVRDSVASPFVAKAGGNLTVRGNKGIDILALNHSQTPFVSGGNLSLISDGNISGDAHFSSGGNFSILNLLGSGGNFVSLYDPIVRSNGDVEIGNYTGASLKIEAVGNITTGAITINRPDTSAAIDVNDPDYQTLTNGKALILRAGNNTLSGSVQELNPLNGASSVNYSSSRSSAGNLTINGNIRSDNFQVPLTVVLEANGNIGSISTRDINSTVFSGDGGNISITANGDITTGELRTFIDFNAPRDITNNGGNITVISSNGNINTLGDILSVTPNGTGGKILLSAPQGSITTTGRTINAQSRNGVAGNVTLQAHDDIRSGNIQASSNSSSGNSSNFSAIELNSSTGSVFLNGVTLSTTNTGTNSAGDIEIKGRNIEITNNSKIESQGREGTVSIGTDDTNTVTINNSRLNTDNNANEISGDIEINGKNIEINNSNITSRGVLGRIFIGTNQNDITADNITIRNSEVNTIRDTDASSNSSPDEINNAIQIFSNRGIQIEESTVTASTLVPGISSGNIILGTVLRTNSSVILSNSSVTAAGRAESSTGGEIAILTDKLKIENGAAVSAESKGKAGNVLVLADQIRLDNGKISASTGENVSADEGAGIALLGNDVTSLEQLANELKNLNSLLANNQLRDDNIPGSQLDFLLLQNNSKIDANAGNSAKGGNIIINTR
ncbi:MAG: beta strand repeat-containing protein, partial [Microcystaceae cyanobacterium]